MSTIKAEATLAETQPKTVSFQHYTLRVNSDLRQPLIERLEELLGNSQLAAIRLNIGDLVHLVEGLEKAKEYGLVLTGLPEVPVASKRRRSYAFEEKVMAYNKLDAINMAAHAFSSSFMPYVEIGILSKLSAKNLTDILVGFSA